MKFVHFDQMFHPDFGDQINLLTKFQVMQGHEVIIVTGNNRVIHPRFKSFADNNNIELKDKEFQQETGVEIIRIDVLMYISGRAIFKSGYKRLIDNLKPDVLFCHYNDSLIGMEYILKSSRLAYPVVFDSHMLRMASRNKFRTIYRTIYRTIFTPKIIGNNLKIIKTQDENYLNIELKIPKRLTPYVSFGTDTELFNFNHENRIHMREKYGIDLDDFVIVVSGKLNESKGGLLLADAVANKFDNKEVTIVIIGNLNSEYEKKVKHELEKSENNIIFLPTQKYRDLNKYYQMSDLSVFPKQSSLSFFDVQACGLPVIAEDNNINIERLAHDNGWVYKQNDYLDLKNTINIALRMSKKEYSIFSSNSMKYIKENFDFKILAEEYTKIMIDEFDKFRK